MNPEYISYDFCQKTLRDGSLMWLVHLNSVLQSGHECSNCPNKDDAIACAIRIKEHLNKILPVSHD